MEECIKTTIELSPALARELKALAKACDLQRNQYIRRVLTNAAAKRIVFEATETAAPPPQLELMAAETPPEYRDSEDLPAPS
jgi:hypothetical protein